MRGFGFFLLGLFKVFHVFGFVFWFWLACRILEFLRRIPIFDLEKKAGVAVFVIGEE